MTDHKAGHPTALYDRRLLLDGAKRNEILELWEVHRYGHDSYGVARVLELSQRNIAALELPIEILNTDYRSGLAHVSLGSDDLLIAFIAPPWGAALISATGLDLDANDTGGRGNS